jgi:1-acyl-sn-glycerol-3-phosphate acyltransferase
MSMVIAGVFRGLRSLFSFVLLLSVFGVGGGVYQRLFLWPVIRLWPHTRPSLMRSFAVTMARLMMRILRLGGATVRRSGMVPTSGPVLVLMNHQSLLDIPISYLLCSPEAPLIVARSRYARGVPVVSLMLRILEYPLVDPDNDPRGTVATLRRATDRAEHGILLFPEGHRSLDGEIGPFESAGVRVILGQRRTPVYLVVTDGWHVTRRLFGFAFAVHKIRGETEVLGPFESPESSRDVLEFVEGLRRTMAIHLGQMRARQGGALNP